MIDITNVEIINKNENHYSDNFIFRIEFDCHDPRISPDKASDSGEIPDQDLGSFVVSGIKPHKNAFTLTANGPSSATVTPETLYDLSAILVKCCYGGAEFARVGFLVKPSLEGYEEPAAIRLQNNTLNPPVQNGNTSSTSANGVLEGGLSTCLPAQIDYSKLCRKIIEDKVFFTKFTIDWGHRVRSEEGSDDGGRPMDDENQSSEGYLEDNNAALEAQSEAEVSEGAMEDD